MTVRPPALLAMGGSVLRDELFSPDLLQRLEGLVDCDTDLVASEFAAISPSVLAQTEVLITSWGSPVVDEAVLAAMPSLRLIVHAAGTVKGHLPEVVWARDIRVTSAAAANAIPVAEFALAQILLAGKNTLAATHNFRMDRGPKVRPGTEVGNYRRKVGLIGASTIGRLLIEHLKPFDLEILVADPTIDQAQAAQLGVTLVGLDELMATCPVVSLHAPILPTTIGMIGAEQTGSAARRRHLHQYRPRGPGRYRRLAGRGPERPHLGVPRRHLARAAGRRRPALGPAERLDHPAHRGVFGQRTAPDDDLCAGRD